MTGIKSRIFPSVLTVRSSLAAGYVHRCVFLFSFSLHFHLLCFLFIINFLQDSSWLLDMFGEPGGSVGSGGGLPTRVLGRVLGSWGSAIIYVLSPRLCGQQQQQSGSNCIELCLDTTVRKKKKKVQPKGSGVLWERMNFVYVLVVTQCFPQLLLWVQAGFFSGWFSTQKASLSHARMTSPLNSVYVPLPRCSLSDLWHTLLVIRRGFVLTLGRQRKKNSETRLFYKHTCGLKSFYGGGLFLRVCVHENKIKTTSKQIMFVLLFLSQCVTCSPVKRGSVCHAKH